MNPPKHFTLLTATRFTADHIGVATGSNVTSNVDAMGTDDNYFQRVSSYGPSNTEI